MDQSEDITIFSLCFSTSILHSQDDGLGDRVKEISSLMSSVESSHPGVSYLISYPSQTRDFLAISIAHKTESEAKTIRSVVLDYIINSCRIDISFKESGVSYFPYFQKRISTIQVPNSDKAKVHPMTLGPPGLSKEDQIITITGSKLLAVDLLNIHCLAELDRARGLFTEEIELPSTVVHSMTGPFRRYLRTIIAKTAASIYFPDPVICSLEEKYQNALIVISSHSQAAALQAREMMEQLYKDKMNSISKREVSVLPKKCDWLLIFKRNELKTIMFENGVLLRFPQLGSNEGRITIYGDDPFYVNQSCEQLMKLTSECHVVNIHVSKNSAPRNTSISFSGVVQSNEKSKFNLKSLEVIHEIAHATGAEVSLKTGNVELYGSAQRVKETFEQLCVSDLFADKVCDCHYQIEQPLESKEFVSGKKDGKINKVMKASNSVVSFIDFNEWNLFIDVSSNFYQSVLMGLDMVEQEIPAELSFHVPEMHHKRIIGHGGKNIQKIMKKFGVYVKFLNAEESKAKFGNYPFKPVSLMHNVIVRTPSKNSAGLYSLKEAVLELSEEKDVEVTSLIFTVPCHLHSSIIYGNSKRISETISSTQIEVSIPKAETASEEITLMGYPSKLKVAKPMFLDLVPWEVSYQIRATAANLNLLSSLEFKQIAKQCDADLITVILPQQNDAILNLIENVTCDFYVTLRATKASKNLAANQSAMAKYFKANDVNVNLTQSPESNSTKSPRVTPLRTLQSDTNVQNLRVRAESPITASSPSSFQFFSSKLYNTGEMSSPILQTRWGTSVDPNERSASVPLPNYGSAKRNLFDGELLSSVPKDDDVGFSIDSSTSLKDRWNTNSPRVKAINLSLDVGRPEERGESTIAKLATENDQQVRNPSRPINRDGILQSPQILKSPYTPAFAGLGLSALPDVLMTPTIKSSLMTPTAAAFFPDSTLQAQYTGIPTPPLGDVSANMYDDKHDDLRELLESLDLEKYYPVFIEQEIDFPTLQTLTDDDLKELGITKLGARRKLLNACSEIFGKRSPPRRAYEETLK